MLYDMEVLLTINTDSNEFTTARYWEGAVKDTTVK